MKQIIYFCDRCKKEIKGEPLQIAVEQVKRGEDAFLSDSPDYFSEKLCGKDFCTECIEGMTAYMIGMCENREFAELFEESDETKAPAEQEHHAGGEKKNSEENGERDAETKNP